MWLNLLSPISLPPSPFLLPLVVAPDWASWYTHTCHYYSLLNFYTGRKGTDKSDQSIFHDSIRMTPRSGRVHCKHTEINTIRRPALSKFLNSSFTNLQQRYLSNRYSKMKQPNTDSAQTCVVCVLVCLEISCSLLQLKLGCKCCCVRAGNL